MSAAPPSLDELLKDVSRSFYLSLRWLPGSVRWPIGLAYLLARATDTVADTEIVPLGKRLAALGELRSRILGERAHPLDFRELARHQGSPGERALLERCEEAVARLPQLCDFDREAVRTVIGTITSGQELDLRRFAGGSAHQITALADDTELDDYTYRVAGCVGEFWTRLCRVHVFPRAAMDDRSLLADAVRFGKGLQLVNILRDVPADLRTGRCYIPATALRGAGLAAGDLLDPANEARFRPVYDRFLARAEAHLRAGWNYTNTLPWRCARVRLSCAWPILIGVKTIAKLRMENVLDPARRIKASRTEVKGLLARSVAWYPWPPAWRKLFPQDSLESCCVPERF